MSSGSNSTRSLCPPQMTMHCRTSASCSSQATPDLHPRDPTNLFMAKKATPDLHPRDPTNLFMAYVSLDPVMVANHSVFCHTWLSHVPYIGQNFSFTYTFLKNNTEDSLWAKCLVDYDKYPPLAQGGPLMLSILLAPQKNTKNH
jgi:hypothetical protein